MKSGVYAIINLVNKKHYVGSTNNLRIRYNAHVSMLRRGVHTNPHLQAAYNKYGEPAFAFHIIEKVPEDELAVREAYWIAALNAVSDGYNIAGTPDHPRKGWHHTEEAKERMSKARMGNKYALGNKHSQETKDKMSEAHRAQWQDRKHRAKTVKAIRKATQDPEYRHGHSERMKRIWAERKANGWTGWQEM